MLDGGGRAIAGGRHSSLILPCSAPSIKHWGFRCDESRRIPVNIAGESRRGRAGDLGQALGEQQVRVLAVRQQAAVHPNQLVDQPL